MPPPTPLPPPPSSSPQRAFNRVSLSASQRSQCAQLKSMAWEVRSGGTTPGTAHDASSARLRVDVEPWEAGSLVLLCPVMGAASPSARASNHSAASAASATKARHDLRRRRALAQLDEAGPQHERPNYSLASPQHERPSPSDGSAARAQGPPAHSKGTPSHKLRLEIDPQFFELLDAAELGAAWHDAYAHAEHAGLPRDACNPFHGGGGAGDGGHDGGTASEGRGDGRGEGRGEGHGEEGGASDGELPGGATTPSTTSYVPAGTAGVRLRALPAARRTNFTPDLFVTYQDAAPRAPVYAAASEESPRLRPDAPLPRGAPSSSGQGRASLRALESLPRMPQGRPSLWPCRLRTGASCAACSLFPPHAGGALRVRRDGARAAAGGAAGVIRLGWLRAPALVAARSPRLQAVVAARGAARPAGRPGSGATRRGRNVSVAVPAWPRKGAPSRPGSTIQTAARIPHRATPLPDPLSPLLGACMQVAEASIPAASIPEALALPLCALSILVLLLGFLLWARHRLARRHPYTASPGEMDGCDDGGSCSSGGGTSGYPSRGTPYWGLVMSSPASSPDASPVASPSRASCSAPART